MQAALLEDSYPEQTQHDCETNHVKPRRCFFCCRNNLAHPPLTSTYFPTPALWFEVLGREVSGGPGPALSRVLPGHSYPELDIYDYVLLAHAFSPRWERFQVVPPPPFSMATLLASLVEQLAGL